MSHDEKKSDSPKTATPAAEKKKDQATPVKTGGADLLQAATSATTREGKVRLRELKKNLELYCHRDKNDLSRDSLKELMASLVTENGVQVPIEYVLLDSEKWLIRGYRRVTACEYLAADKVPGFSLDMELPSREVVGALPADLVVRSIVDNEHREALKGIPRIKAIKMLVDLGVSDARVMNALRLTPQTYKRDKLNATHPWMLGLITSHKISQTAASILLDEAEKVGRLDELRAELSDWIAIKERELDEKDRVQKEKTGKELKPGEKQVKKLLPNDLLAHWVSQIRKKESLATTTTWNFAAGFDATKEVLYLGGKTLSLRDLPPAQVASVLGKLSQVVKTMSPYAKKRYELEQLAGETTSQDGVVDVNFLRALGLGSIVNELAQDPGNPAERAESGEQGATEDLGGAEVD